MANLKKRPVAKKKTSKKKPTRTQLIKSLDKVFSIFIRQRDDGVCFTCGTRQEWKYMQNGHFVSRGKFATRWDERNCHCQCVGCNVFRNGNYPVYAERMIYLYGPEIIEELNRKGREIARWSSNDLEDMISHYKKLI